MADANAFPGLQISAYWRSVHDDLMSIVDLFPSGKLNWTPQENLWNARGILIHVADARDGWLADGHHGVHDGEAYPNIWQTARSRDDIKRELERTFERVQRFLRNSAQLEAIYTDEWQGEKLVRDGHWIAFHLLEHDIHHRADLLLYLALCGVETPQVWTP
jgi:uncharacterized damage-inducible protein DinB